MASKMYSGFIADYINSQIQVIACNHIDGEMAVCCPQRPQRGQPDSREKRDRTRKHGNDDKKWIWDTEEVTSSEEVQSSKRPAPPQYPMSQYVSYPIQGFYPFSKPNGKSQNSSPFLAEHEDPNSMKNCPPPFSAEFNLPKNHTFYKEPAITTTPTSRVEAITVAPAPELSPEMQAKMVLINDASCGRSVGSRITGGQDAGIGRFSWMGRLAYRNKSLSSANNL